MYHLDHIVRMYYHSVTAREIINRIISYDNFPKEEFAGLSRVYLRQYSDTEDNQLYQYIQDSIQEEGHPYAGMERRGGLNVFAALEELSEQLLTLEDNEVLCQYGNLLRLREISQHVEEDLLVCAFLAAHCRRYGKRHDNFGWDFTIGHNNTQLDRIMRKGLSENHFHMFGSAPAFHLIWISFMNDVDNAVLAQWGELVEKQRRMTKEHYGKNYSEDSFAVGVMKAALIRICLVRYLIERDVPRGNGHLESEIGKLFAGRDLEGAFTEGETEKSFAERETEEPLTEMEIEELISGQRDIMERCHDIQKMVDRIKDLAFWKGMGELADYALYSVENVGMAEPQNRWAVGERWLMYRMLVEELEHEAAKGSRAEKYYNWFYAYLVLKQSVRNEIIQTNQTVGFENFHIYTKRKNIYKNVERMVETAVFGSVNKGNIRCLEMRVTPEEKAASNAIWIQRMDEIIQRRKEAFPEFEYYYVFHFSKSQEEELGDWDHFDGRRCRHYEKRWKLEQIANEIALFRENYRAQASRVLGIDACAQEIGCRPEVFATVFRFLANHTVEDIPGTEKICQLRMTYHVGEDFLDVVDGLRAVDEAILFLNLRCGDRIGHGTVLGLDAVKWYQFKENTIVLKQQDYLDNVVWLYHKLTEYKIEGAENLREWLRQEFRLYFMEIYLHTRRGNRELYFDINTYYEAWKLRGDDPELYITNQFDKEGVFYGREWLINRKFPEKPHNRKRKEVVNLYWLYHYDWDVRKNGKKSIQKYVPPFYVEGVAAVQKAMGRNFASKGIGIEANPSSNFAISTMTKYSEHPVVRLYNKDLTWDAEQIRECPQVNVSINTDDKGVFHTSLENEYALMACAMERERDEEGNPVYNRQMIYQWIDNIREMGNMQSFLGNR